MSPAENGITALDSQMGILEFSFCVNFIIFLKLMEKLLQTFPKIMKIIFLLKNELHGRLPRARRAVTLFPFLIIDLLQNNSGSFYALALQEKTA